MLPILKTWLRKLASARELARDLVLALTEPPAITRVCRRCWHLDPHAADLIPYGFEDAGACSRCGEVAEPADSVAVVPHR